MARYTKGWKYQLEDSFYIKLKTESIKIKNEYFCRYYQAHTDGTIGFVEGCCWDGPTWFPDFQWMMLPSLIHDVLHWLIAKGVIDESQNDLIDEELAAWIKTNKGWPRLFKFRSWYVKTMTHLVDQKQGDLKKRYPLW